MNDTTLPADTLSALANADVQRQAAQMAQDAFSRIFRLTLEADITELDATVGELAKRIANWVRAAGSDDGRALRMALLISGLDQWGVAYTQAFALTAISGLSALVGHLRTGLDARDEDRFVQQFSALESSEGNAIDFKMELRRNIHLALWHALIAAAADDPVDSQHLVNTLGSLMLALIGRMPALGWRLVADTLAHIQIRCLTMALEAPAQQHTEALFASLRHALAREQGHALFSLANQAAVRWRQANRSSTQVVH